MYILWQKIGLISWTRTTNINIHCISSVNLYCLKCKQYRLIMGISDYCLLWCNTLLLGRWALPLWRNVLRLSPTWKEEEAHSTKMLEPIYWTTPRPHFMPVFSHFVALKPLTNLCHFLIYALSFFCLTYFGCFICIYSSLVFLWECHFLFWPTFSGTQLGHKTSPCFPGHCVPENSNFYP